MNENDIIYFEVNNWFAGRDYPSEEPFLSWMGNDLKLRLADDEWCKQQKICVIKFNADMSMNFLVTAPRKWCEENCPCILEERNAGFLRHRDDEDDLYVYSNLIESAPFADYEEYNFGSEWEDYDKEYYGYGDEDEDDEDEDDEDEDEDEDDEE